LLVDGASSSAARAHPLVGAGATWLCLTGAIPWDWRRRFPSATAVLDELLAAGPHLDALRQRATSQEPALAGAADGSRPRQLGSGNGGGGGGNGGWLGSRVRLVGPVAVAEVGRGRNGWSEAEVDDVLRELRELDGHPTVAVGALVLVAAAPLVSARPQPDGRWDLAVAAGTGADEGDGFGDAGSPRAEINTWSEEEKDEVGWEEGDIPRRCRHSFKARTRRCSNASLRRASSPPEVVSVIGPSNTSAWHRRGTATAESRAAAVALDGASTASTVSARILAKLLAWGSGRAGHGAGAGGMEGPRTVVVAALDNGLPCHVELTFRAAAPGERATAPGERAWPSPSVRLVVVADPERRGSPQDVGARRGGGSGGGAERSGLADEEVNPAEWRSVVTDLSASQGLVGPAIATLRTFPVFTDGQCKAIFSPTSSHVANIRRRWQFFFLLPILRFVFHSRSFFPPQSHSAHRYPAPVALGGAPWWARRARAARAVPSAR
jgi:hypothetical protein